MVSKEERQGAIALAQQASKVAALEAMTAFGRLHLVVGGPHGVNLSRAVKWNRVVLEFLAR